ncbi:MAG TPA: energy transducer TonB [Flavisolibacter sp.]|nr:energy transducer TonB [Flavisolibacter sp.]
MKELINYTVQDIERYHNGGMSPAQMHALEKAALDDAFLADALEGYVFTKTPSADAATLQQRLAGRIKEDEKRKAVFILQPWMRLAALFIIIAGGGWIIVQSLNLSSKNEVAVTTATTKQPATVTPQTLNNDSASTFPGASASSETTAATNSATIPERERYKTQGTKGHEGQLSAPTANGVLKKESSDPTVMTLKKDETEIRIDSPVNSTTMFDEALVSKRSKTNDTIRNVDVVLQKSERELEEVVVVKQKPQATAARSRKMMMQVDTLEPANGWAYFDDYIASNLKSPDELKMKPVNGEVELSFELNKEGEPVNITVTKSLCERCDAEAIRLLKEGPKWKYKAKKGRVKIKF